jgi:hypothetical protein
MATYVVNRNGGAKARSLIDAHHYRVRSRWADVQPRASEQNAFLKAHGWKEYASWHLALTEGASDETKGRYGFVFGDFRRLHRMGLIACVLPSGRVGAHRGHDRRTQPAPLSRQVARVMIGRRRTMTTRDTEANLMWARETRSSRLSPRASAWRVGHPRDESVTGTRRSCSSSRT